MGPAGWPDSSRGECLMGERHEESQIISRFLDWLDRERYYVCEISTGLEITDKSIEQLLTDYFKDKSS